MNDLPFMQDGGFSSVNNNRNDRWDEGVEWFKLKSGWNRLRFVGPITITLVHWVNTSKGKSVPVLCLDWDVAKGAKKPAAEQKCPICKNFDFSSNEERIKRLAPRRQGLGHVIVRGLQQDMPNSPEKWYKPIQIPSSLVQTLGKLKELNTVEYQGKTYQVDVNDPNYGCDVQVNYDPMSNEPSKKYSAQKEVVSPPSDIEKQAAAQHTINFAERVFTKTVEDVENMLAQQGYIQKEGVRPVTGAPQMSSMPAPQQQVNTIPATTPVNTMPPPGADTPFQVSTTNPPPQGGQMPPPPGGSAVPPPPGGAAVPPPPQGGQMPPPPGGSAVPPPPGGAAVPPPPGASNNDSLSMGDIPPPPTSAPWES